MTDTTQTTDTIDPQTGEVLEENTTVEDVAKAAEQQANAQGQSLETIITTHTFLPPGADGDDPQLDPRRVIGMQKTGSRIMLGSLAGYITRIERKTQEWQGKQLSSVWLHGRFTAFNYATQEELKAPVAILPRAYGDMIENAVLAGIAAGMNPHELRADLDVEIGVKSTGRSIPFAWCLLNFIEDETDRRVKQIRARQEARLAHRRTQALIASSGSADVAALPEPKRASRK